MIKDAASNLIWSMGKVTYEERCSLLNQKGLVVWFTGMSGAGKSTIAIEAERINSSGEAFVQAGWGVI